MHYRCVIIVLFHSIQVLCQNNDNVASELPTRITNQVLSNKNQENNDDINLDPTDMLAEDIDPQKLDATEWLNMVLSESLKNKHNHLNAEKPSLPEDTDSQKLDATEWLDTFLSDTLNNQNNRINAETPSLSENKEECTTKDNLAGKCVEYYQCDPDYTTVIEDGSTIIDFRSEASCPHYLQVCCVLDKIITHANDTSIKTADENPFGEESNKCGWNNPALNIFKPKSKETADNSPYANYGDFPWMIALIRKITESAVWSNKHYLGGGSLIQPGVVLTVAHKIKEIAAEDLKCRAGEWDTQTTYELFAHQERDVERKIIHPDYFRQSLYYDIGLLFLNSPFDLTQSPNIGLACVGTTLPPPGTECFSMGWGKEFSRKNKYAVILKKVRVPLVSAPSCQSRLRKSRLGQFFELHKSLTCAGGEVGVDTCLRDGGSSLVCPVQTLGQSTRFAVFGMVAYGIQCGKYYPAVYANVPHLKPWLDMTIANEGLTTDLFTYSV